jgi:hypothetical protein
MLVWVDSYGTKHTKRISHTNQSGTPLCQTAPTYKKYKRLLQTDEYSADDKILATLLLGAEPTYEQPYINTVDFEIKEQDVRKLNAKQQVVPKNAEIQQVQELLGDENNETAEDVVAIPLTSKSLVDIKSEKLLTHFKLGHLSFAAINQWQARVNYPKG